jgi:hypothetical protein
MKRSKKIQAYGELNELAPDLWVMDGAWNGSAFGRRMTVIRLSDGSIVVHNAFRLEEKDLAKISQLGEVKWIVVPNRFHSSEAYFFQEKFPAARIMASRWAKKNLLSTGLKEFHWLPESWAAERDSILAKELPVFSLRGMRGLGEFVFLHKASRTLLVTDLVFHMTHAKNAMERSFLRLNGIFKEFGPSRIAKLLFTRNERELGESLAEIVKQDFDRVIMNHGEILKQGGPKALRESFVKRFPKIREVFQEH